MFPELSQTRSPSRPNSLGWLFAGVSIGALLMGLSSGWVTRVDRQGAVVLGRDRGLGRGDHRVRVRARAVAGRPLPGRRRRRDMVSAVLRTSMLQIAAPEEMRGRMQGVFIVVVAGGPRLGDLRAGALASVDVGDRRDGLRRGGDRRGDGRRRPRGALVLAVPRLAGRGRLGVAPRVVRAPPSAGARRGQEQQRNGGSHEQETADRVAPGGG